MKLITYGLLCLAAFGAEICSADGIPTPAPKRIAVIGAGASGTSAAYFIQQGMANASTPVSITVYERSDQVGGRVNAITVPGTNLMIETGAAIFIDTNANLIKYAAQFNLTVQPAASGLSNTHANPKLGIWNGTDFSFMQTGNATADQAVIVSRFGVYSIGAISQLIQSYAVQFLKVYYPAAVNGTFDTMRSILEYLGLQSTTQATAQNALNAAIPNLNANYLAEVVEIATRENYGQGLAQIHTMGMAISVAGSSGIAYQVQGGNQQVFQKLLAASGATVHLKTPVAAISKSVATTGDIEGAVQYTVTTEAGSSAVYDAVVMASPPIATTTYSNAKSSITWQNLTTPNYFTTPNALVTPPVTYRSIHVTIVAGVVNPLYFKARSFSQLPLAIYSTQDASATCPFTSLVVHEVLTFAQVLKIAAASLYTNRSAIEPTAFFTLTKVFSPEALTERQLARLYGVRFWTYQTSYNAYPNLVPRDEGQFPPLTVDTQLYYPNAFEPFISTMETSMISSQNVANLLVRDLTQSA
ncbi:hypothetical protein IWQ60_005408 [Tieghemiomyces parasiticus]|uniref:Prenylcysteine lyase domain-containing protein n=1 Tax=Tieghemiomyces parasiticus TaxID=78921 RepID=A0A9W8DYX2_9FUNG|nr:hypothetical protein IWQ60_005408 [Tieghemiomyces parasiticus]